MLRDLHAAAARGLADEPTHRVAGYIFTPSAKVAVDDIFIEPELRRASRPAWTHTSMGKLLPAHRSITFIMALGSTPDSSANFWSAANRLASSSVLKNFRNEFRSM